MSGQPESNNSFMDPKTLLAIVVCAVVFFGWQSFMAKKYPDYYKPKPVATDPANAPTGETVAGTPTPVPGSPMVPVGAAAAAVGATDEMQVAETVLTYENELVGFEVSSKGMGLQKLHLKKYKNSENKEMTLGGADSQRIFEVGLVGQTQPLNFAVQRTGENQFVGQARVGQMLITNQMEIDPQTSKIDSNVKLENVPADFPGLVVRLAEPRRPSAGKSFFMPSMDHQELIAKSDGSIHRMTPKEGEGVTEDYQSGTLWAIGSQYFVTAINDQSAITPEVKLEAPIVGALQATAIYKPVSVTPTMEFKWTGYAGGKSLALLQKASPELGELVNYGFFAPIGRILLKILIWSHEQVGNWGWAIITLTVIVRLLVLPFNILSYRSMKKMQKIQPLLASLRERYKEDPPAMNRETMALMREQKVNPIGGCLPMMLQMPVFFALYQVLGQSIELYQAPFIFWIHDLSQKDPFYVLPVLMGMTMFVQQKITPTTMDPMQAKIMLWMPLIFGVFTLGLPSGLTLYIFISTLFGVIQQQIFMRNPGSSAQVGGTKTPAKA